AVVDVGRLGWLDAVQDVRVRQVGGEVGVRGEHATGGPHDRADEGQAEDAERDEQEGGEASSSGAATGRPSRHHQVTAAALKSRMHRAEGYQRTVVRSNRLSAPS